MTNMVPSVASMSGILSTTMSSALSRPASAPATITAMIATIPTWLYDDHRLRGDGHTEPRHRADGHVHSADGHGERDTEAEDRGDGDVPQGVEEGRGVAEGRLAQREVHEERDGDEDEAVLDDRVLDARTGGERGRGRRFHGGALGGGHGVLPGVACGGAGVGGRWKSWTGRRPSDRRRDRPDDPVPLRVLAVRVEMDLTGRENDDPVGDLQDFVHIGRQNQDRRTLRRQRTGTAADVAPGVDVHPSERLVQQQYRGRPAASGRRRPSAGCRRTVPRRAGSPRAMMPSRPHLSRPRRRSAGARISVPLPNRLRNGNEICSDDRPTRDDCLPCGSSGSRYMPGPRRRRGARRKASPPSSRSRPAPFRAEQPRRQLRLAAAQQPDNTVTWLSCRSRSDGRPSASPHAAQRSRVRPARPRRGAPRLVRGAGEQALSTLASRRA